MENLTGPTAGLLVGLAGLMLTAAGAVAGWAIRINKGERADASAKNAHERIDAEGLRVNHLVRTELSAAHMRMDTIVRDLADFREYVAREYASGHRLEQMETRIGAAINHLGERLDKVFEPKGSAG